jgi:hypothetical protein
MSSLAHNAALAVVTHSHMIRWPRFSLTSEASSSSRLSLSNLQRSLECQQQIDRKWTCMFKNLPLFALLDFGDVRSAPADMSFLRLKNQEKTDDSDFICASNGLGIRP